MRSLISLAGVVAAVALPLQASAQESDSTCIVELRTTQPAGVVADVARLLDLQDTASRTSFVLRRPSHVFRGNACNAPAHLRDLARNLSTAASYIMPAELLVTGNSAYPRDWNDGALWSGRGLGMSLTAGAEAWWGPVRIAIMPVITWQRNGEFAIRTSSDTSRSELAHPWFGNAIDLPQRPGYGSFATVEPGQSFARIDLGGVGVGVSSENLIWGPSRRNPLLLSATAPGFAHAFIETSRPTDIWIGDLDLQLFWGRLDESSYFDHEPDNDHRLLAGLLVAFEPRVLEGLTVGAGRLQSLTWWPELTLSDVLLRPYRGVGANPKGRAGDNQLINAFFRWTAAPAGIEAYGEWAREDHWGSAVQLLRNLDGSQAWTLGLQKLIRRGDDALRISTEVTHLSDALPIMFAGRNVLSFYTNTSVTQGHTHRGQLLGAAIGTGAESLFLGVDWFWSVGRSGLSIERTRYEDDAYNANYAAEFGAHARDTELSVRGNHAMLLRGFVIDAELGWSVRYNRGFLGLDLIEPGGEYRRDDNLSVRIGARWSPGLSR